MHPSLGVELQVCGKILLDRAGVIHRRISLHDLSLSVDEKFGEVPLDAIPHEASSIWLLFEPLPQGVGVIPVHIDLAEHIILSVVTLGKLLDLSVSAWFLPSKLVGREGQDT